MRLLFVGLLTLCIFALLHLCQVVSLRPDAYSLVAIDSMTRVRPLVTWNEHRQYPQYHPVPNVASWPTSGPYPYIEHARHAMPRWQILLSVDD